MLGFEMLRQLRNQFCSERVGAFDDKAFGFGSRNTKRDAESE